MGNRCPSQTAFPVPLSEISGTCCHRLSAEERVCQCHPTCCGGRKLPRVVHEAAGSMEDETPGNQEKLVYDEEGGLDDSSPGDGFSQDQKVVELSGGSSSSVYIGAIEHPLRWPRMVGAGVGKPRPSPHSATLCPNFTFSSEGWRENNSSGPIALL